MTAGPPDFAPPLVVTEPLPSGGLLLRSPVPLGSFPRCVGDMLERAARDVPDRTFLAERAAPDAPWTKMSYAEALAAVRAMGASLLALGLDATRPLMLLSDNGIDHALLQLAAMHVGVPAAPVSPAYSLLSQDFAKLMDVFGQLAPGAVFASNGAVYAKALAAIDREDVTVIVGKNPPGGLRRARQLLVRDLARAGDGPTALAAFAAVGPDTVAKVLFTSGSTGAPKGIVNTHRMLCSNQQAIVQLWPFLRERPPVILDWLPWSHTFGGNHNFDMILMNAGTLYVDAGKPAPGLLEKTVKNLADVSPTIAFNVPRGFDMLLPFLEQDEGLRARFFRNLRVLFYAAAALPQRTWERLEAVAARAGVTDLAMVSAWGSTETAPLATSVHYPIARAGIIGLPAPGTDIALVPEAGSDKLELRVKGPNVTPGCWEPGGRIRPVDRDERGFLRTGDAGKLADPADPAKGIVFDGRTAENFKLTSGTWVLVGELRVAIVGACAPLVQDVVVAGHDRDYLASLVFTNPLAVKDLPREEVRARVLASLEAFNRDHPATTTRVARALLVEEPPSIDAGEITDKGYVNQRAVLARRAADVERLYAPKPDRDVLVPRA